MTGRKALVLMSGGVDSLVHAVWAIEQYGHSQVTGLFVDLGQPYVKKERAAARKLSKAIGIELQEIEMKWLGTRTNPVDGHVPMRNLFILLRAALELNGSGDIIFGMLKNEAPEDKNRGFVGRVQRLLDSQTAGNIYQERTRVRVLHPFSNRTKTQMLRWYLTRKFPSNLLLTSVGCFQSTEDKQCGWCISCFNRWAALTNNGLQEPYREGNHPWLWAMSQLGTGKINASEVGFVQKIIGLWRKRYWLFEIHAAWVKSGRIEPHPWDTLKAGWQKRKQS